MDKNLKKVDWEVSQKTIDLVKSYSEYTENEVVEYYLNCIREDKKFKEWVLKKRNNKVF
ncbi:hypothetical protein [Metabacillus fastidiosus]|uniref:hypothetical protein n=1 Tax=Metabacillus fastidiosus TaxID=1458 RepID=UPI003D2B851D